MDFVRGVGIPDDQFPVLRRGDQVAPVCGPMHRVNLGQMAFQSALRAHADAGERLRLGLRDMTDCETTTRPCCVSLEIDWPNDVIAVTRNNR